MIKWTFVGREGKKSDSYHSKESVNRYSGITDMKNKESADRHIDMTNMRTKEESFTSSCFADRSQVTVPIMSNFIAYQKMFSGTNDA